MLTSYLQQIRMIRGTPDLIFNRSNRNRYTVLVTENDGASTAYCFSTPIYHAISRRLVTGAFQPWETGYRCVGSNAETTVKAGEIYLQNGEGGARVTFENAAPPSGDAGGVTCGTWRLTSSANGVLFNTASTRGGVRLQLTAETPPLPVRANGKYFALMSEEFRPFLTVSAIGVTDPMGRVCAPAAVTFQQLDDNRYTVVAAPLEAVGSRLLFEVNLYEPKLFQDTTVESRNPQENNAFGGVAFLGDSAAYGEQWLYTRPDLTKLPMLLDRPVRSVRLYLPNLSGRRLRLTAHRCVQRFCSFGSNWENKVPLADGEAESESIDGFERLDLTALLTHPPARALQPSEGLILRSAVKGSGFTALATGDSYSTPQILEITFK